MDLDKTYKDSHGNVRKVVFTDLDLPPARRTEANLWEAKYFNAYKELVNANKGIKRLKKRLIQSQLRAFVDGAKWWAYKSRGATMWPHHNGSAEKEAERRYNAE